MTKAEVNRDINNYTEPELREMYKLNKKELQDYLSTYRLKPKYSRRTRVSGGLVPIKGTLARCVGKAREDENIKFRQFMTSDWFKNLHDKHVEWLEERQAHLGVLIANKVKIEDEIAVTQHTIARFKQFLKVLEYSKTDPATFWEEELYGKKPVVEDSSEGLNCDKAVLCYIATKYGFEIGHAVHDLLLAQNKELGSDDECTD